jgi:hypothetical protein
MKEKKKLDTKDFLRKQQEPKILEGYYLINGAKLWYQIMRTSWSHGWYHTKWCEPRDHVVMQRHQFLKSQVNQVW